MSERKYFDQLGSGSFGYTYKGYFIWGVDLKTTVLANDTLVFRELPTQDAFGRTIDKRGPRNHQKINITLVSTAGVPRYVFLTNGLSTADSAKFEDTLTGTYYAPKQSSGSGVATDTYKNQKRVMFNDGIPANGLLHVEY